MSKIQVNDIVNHFDDGAPNFPKGIVVGSGATLGFNVGTGASIYSPSDNVLTLGTNNTEKVRIDSGGNVGIGTDNPQTITHIFGPNPILRIQDSSAPIADAFAAIQLGESNSGGAIQNYWQFALEGDSGTSTDHFTIKDGTGERLRITSGGNVGIGTDNPDYSLTIGDGSSYVIQNLKSKNDEFGEFRFGDPEGIAQGKITYDHGTDSLRFTTNGDGEKLRIDSSGRLLVGTSSAVKNADRLSGNKIALVGTGTNFPSAIITSYATANADAGPLIEMQKSRGETDGSMTIVAANDRLGGLQFLGSDGTNFVRGAAITGYVDGTPGANDMPGRLTFSTNPGSPATAPTERMRIGSDGAITQTQGYSLSTALYTGDVTDNGSGGSATFDVTLNFADANNFMIVEIFGYHRAYNGTQEYYRFMASHSTVNNLYNHDIIDDLTSTGSITQTNTSVTFTGRRPRSFTGTSINSTIRILYRGLIVPASVTIANS